MKKKTHAKKGKRMAVGGAVGYGGTKTNDPVGRGGVGGTGLGGVSGGIRGGGQGRGGPAGGVTTGTTTGTSATNRPAPRPMPGRPAPAAPAMRPPKMDRPKRPATPAIMPEVEEYTPPEVPDEVLPAPPRRAPLAYENMGPMFKRQESGTNWPGQGRGNFGRPMRGGGLAKKGVGQALAKGGLVKGAGCAKRGVKKPRYT